MPFEITVSREFCAAHQLRLADGTLEPLHGHNWHLRVTVAADNLDAIGTVMDFHELARLVDDIIGPMNNSNLNELPALKSTNPSAENVVLHVARSLKLPNKVRLISVEVTEAPNCVARYVP
jgi:6-pyruvoyltetrahydropterin/6-carboxytetrahydropterin synthase